MRLRSLVTALGASGLVVAALVRCNLPDLPPGPQAIPTRIGLIGGAFLRLPAAPVDHAALIASMKEMGFRSVAIESVADASGSYVADRVALAIELQSALDADVFIGTYRYTFTDPNDFTSCYPGSLAFSATQSPPPSFDDKLIACSKAASDQVAAALRAANAPSRIGCYITQPTTVSATADQGALANLLQFGAGQCAADGRFVGISARLDVTADPTKSAMVYRNAIGDSGVNVLMLDDRGGHGDVPPAAAAVYYQDFRNAITDRLPSVLVWANVEAYACSDGTCLTTTPASSTRLFTQLCAARRRVDGIIATEYFDDLAGRSFVDASADAGDASDDFDASAQLRNAYLQWVDSGAPCN